MFSHSFNYKDDVRHGVLRLFTDEPILELLESQNIVQTEDSVQESKYLHYNDYKYLNGLLIVHDKRFLEIFHLFPMCG